MAFAYRSKTQIGTARKDFLEGLVIALDDIPAGVLIVKITAELDKTFMSIGYILVDYWPRTSFLVTHVVKRQRHKNARVISKV